MYVLTPQGVAEKAMLAGRFLKRKMPEYEALRIEIDELTNEAKTAKETAKTALMCATPKCDVKSI